MIGIRFYCLLAPTLYQSTTFNELVNNGGTLALGSAVLWGDVPIDIDGSQPFFVCKNT